MNHYIKTALFLVLSFATAGPVISQEVWSLERCVNYALENNLANKQAQAAVRTAQLSESQAKSARLPSINASVSGGEQFGRTIDPTTNQFNNTGIGFSSLGVNAGVTLYSGGQINNAVRQAKWDTQAAVADADNYANTLALQVAQAYLSILLSEEQLVSAKRRLDLSKKQLESTLKLINAGNLPMADRYNLDAQIARDEQAVVVAQNSVELGYLALKHLLQLEPDAELLIEHPLVQIPADANPDAFTFSTLYTTAMGTQPNIKASEFRIKSAETAVRLAKGSYYPTLSLGANLSSNYSSQFKTPVYTGNLVTDPPFLVDIGGMQVPISFIREEYYLERVPYFDQIDQNFGQGIFMSLNIPIYNNGRTRLSVERARLAVLNAQLQDAQTRQQLKNDVQTAIANARAARKQLDAAQRTYDATKTAYQNTEKRQQLGAVNTLEFVTAKTNLDIAENELLIARYDYLFKLKILDFYQGKPLSLR